MKKSLRGDEKCRVYIACAITDAPAWATVAAALRHGLAREMDVLPSWSAIDHGGRTPEPGEILKWDRGQVHRCHVLLALVDIDSLGVGWEIHEGIGQGKRVLMMHRSPERCSKLISDLCYEHPGLVTLQAYETPRDIMSYVRQAAVELGFSVPDLVTPVFMAGNRNPLSLV